MNNVSVYNQKPSDFQQGVAGVCCYCQWGEKFLFLRKARTQKWVAPGGTVEEGEKLESAMVRELFEETGISLKQNQLDSSGQHFVRKKDIDYTLHVFHFRFAQCPEVILSHEHSDMRWVTLCQALELPLIEGSEIIIKHHERNGI